MKKLYLGLLAVMLIVIIAAAAWFAWFSNPTAPAQNKIGLILGTGGLGDKSFNDIAFAGAERAKDELGIVFDYAEPKAISEYEGFQTNFAKTGEYALIVCIGFDQADALNVTAQAYPNQNFALVDMVVELPNIASLTFKANEGSFLTGVIAGMFTQTNKLGFVGGMDIPLIRDFYVGYKAGVEWANPTATVLDPVFVGGWGDPTRGKELAVSLIGLGADGIFAAAGKSGLGALEGVHENGIMGFGVDSCQDYLYAEIVASMTKRVDVAVYEMIEDAVKGEFKGGIYSGGLAEKWTGCSRLPDEESFWEATFDFTYAPLPENVVTKLTDANAEIIAGTITVPSGYT
jgi:basic membrane protein A and related proteins